MKATIHAVCTGTARPFNGAELSAISKYPREGIVQLLEEGLAPDEQADRRHHGGPDMALHLYPLDHHDFWREELGEVELLDQAGAFGSNLGVRGILEDQVHIGDQFRLGSALIEISQPRQPCWKIDHRFGQKHMVKKIVQTGKSGWYFRVLENGDVQAGDTIERVRLGELDWSVARAFRVAMAGKGTREELVELAGLEVLSNRVREKILAKLG